MHSGSDIYTKLLTVSGVLQGMFVLAVFAGTWYDKYEIL